MRDWEVLIGRMIQVRQLIQELDSTSLWNYELPQLGASEATVLALEASLGERLPNDYRQFLLHADGWSGFYQRVDLLSTGQLLDSTTKAYHLLASIEPAVMTAGGVFADQLLPIAASNDDLDLFVLGRARSAISGSVIWLAASEVDRFQTFTDFFLAMIEYNKLEIGNLAATPKPMVGPDELPS